jgi:hypothetical protein
MPGVCKNNVARAAPQSGAGKEKRKPYLVIAPECFNVAVVGPCGRGVSWRCEINVALCVTAGRFLFPVRNIERAARAKV